VFFSAADDGGSFGGLVKLGARGASVVLAAIAGVGANACGGAPPAPVAAVAVEGPEDAILRIARTWEARHAEKGLRSSPSPIAAFDRQLVSRIVLAPGATTATEALTFSERFTLRDGTSVACGGSAELPVSVSYGRKAGEPALELAWPALLQPRACEPAHGGIPELERAPGRARFVLRSDQLVGVEPALEKRTFLPVD
jgi:hypothetical protein